MGQKRMKRQVDDDDIASSANAEPRKRQKQYSETDAKLANIFNKLADEVQTERESATKELIALLDVDDAGKVRKVLNRLIRGLCSGRKAARFGFAIALTDILGRLHGSGESNASTEFTASRLINVVREQTQPEGKVSGQEKRDYALGRLFGYKAIIESQILKDSDDRSRLVDSIFQLSVDLPFLREECGRTICDYAKQLSSQPDSVQTDAATVLERLKSTGLEKTPEGIAIWLTVRSQFPKCDLPSGTWHKNDPLSKKERQTLANILKGGQDVANSAAESTKTENGLKKPKPNAPQSTPNFAWDIVLHSMVEKQEELNAEDDKGYNTSEYAKFWNEVVDGSLFSAAASPQRKLLGFQVFTKALSICPDWVLPTLFSTNLRRCLINQRKDSERYLHNAAKASLGAIHARVSSSPDTAAAMVFGLAEEGKGFVNFDRLTQSKTIENILAVASDEALLEVISLFFLNQLTDVHETSSADNVRRSLADMLIQLVRNRKEEQLSALVAIKGETWLHKLLDTFVQFAHFAPASATKHASPSPPVSEASRSMFQSRLSSCLTHLLSSKIDGSIVMPYYVIQRIRRYRKSSSGLESTLQADKQVARAIKEAQSTTDDINIKEAAAEGSQKAVLRAFKLLFCLTIIQAYNGEADAVDLLGELQTCYQSASEGVAAETRAFDMLIEVLLGFVSKQSVLFRKSAEQAFAAFASELTSDSLQSMLDILEKKESLAGQQDLFDQDAEMDGEGDEEEDGDVDMDEVASDVEVVDGLEASDVEEINGEEDGSEAVDGDEDETDAEEDEEETRFKSLLAEALKTSGAQADGESSSEDNEDMDDDEMMALEPALTKIFKERKKSATGKREKKDAKELIINFKNRVLDLLSIFVKQQYGNPLALDLILPITRLVRTTTSQQVANKAFELLKQYFDTCKKKQTIPTLSRVDDIIATLTDIHQEALKGSKSKVHAHACARSSLFLAKVVVTADRTNYATADRIYADTRAEWFSNQKCSLPVSFFIEWENWSNEMRKQK